MFFTCRQLARNVDLLEAPETPALHRFVGRLHVKGCRGCARFVAQYQATQQALSNLAVPPEASPAQAAQSLAVFRQWQATSRAP